MLSAAERYDRYQKSSDGNVPAGRRRELKKIAADSIELVSRLSRLNIISRDELDSSLGLEKIEILIGHLLCLYGEARIIYSPLKKRGAPGNVAQNIWISEVADIFETNFRKEPKVTGNNSTSIEKRGKFFRLLDISRPLSLPRHGTLGPNQVRRVLNNRLGYAKNEKTIAPKTVVPVIENDEIEQAAAELVVRFGDGAITAARERVETLSGSDDPQAHNAALRVLTAVEGLVGAKGQSGSGNDQEN